MQQAPSEEGAGRRWDRLHVVRGVLCQGYSHFLRATTILAVVGFVSV